MVLLGGAALLPMAADAGGAAGNASAGSQQFLRAAQCENTASWSGCWSASCIKCNGEGALSCVDTGTFGGCWGCASSDNTCQQREEYRLAGESIVFRNAGFPGYRMCLGCRAVGSRLTATSDNWGWWDSLHSGTDMFDLYEVPGDVPLYVVAASRQSQSSGFAAAVVKGWSGVIDDAVGVNLKGRMPGDSLSPSSVMLRICRACDVPPGQGFRIGAVLPGSTRLVWLYMAATSYGIYASERTADAGLWMPGRHDANYVALPTHATQCCPH
uniref:Uncharacterized protein n=1 Tax=Zooxanthella nutricula TaxID=1333877 RepID=A0A7S2VJA3_9DINO